MPDGVLEVLRLYCTLLFAVNFLVWSKSRTKYLISERAMI